MSWVPDKTSISSNKIENISDISKKIETLLKPLSNPVRQHLLLLLSQGPITYTEIYQQLKLESGSFYWHIKKMESLIEQTEDKKYFLSDFGKRAYHLLYSKGGVGEGFETPRWINSIVILTGRLTNTPNWIIIQQILFIITITAIGFSSVDIIQIGSIPSFYKNSTFLISFISLSLSIIIPSIMLIVILALNEKRNSRTVSRNELFSSFINILFVNSFIFLPGLISSLIIQITENPNLGLELYIIIPVVFISTIISLLLSMSVIISNFDYDYKTALLFTLISFYPYLITSFSIQFWI